MTNISRVISDCLLSRSESRREQVQLLVELKIHCEYQQDVRNYSPQSQLDLDMELLQVLKFF